MRKSLKGFESLGKMSKACGCNHGAQKTCEPTLTKTNLFIRIWLVQLSTISGQYLYSYLLSGPYLVPVEMPRFH